MKLLENNWQLSRFTRITLITSIVLLTYGYLCRLFGINFFWESKSIGWAALLVGLISLLADRINVKDEQNKTSLLEKIGIGFLVFILFVQCILVAVIPFSNAFGSAKTYILKDDTVRKELGEIQGFGLIPTGGIQKATDSSGEYGSAELNLTIKGERKFKDVKVYVVKTSDSPDWKVESLE